MAYYILKSYKLKVNPLNIFLALKDKRFCFFLDSSLNANALGRYSFLGIDPFFILKTKAENPFKKIGSILDKFNISLSKNTLPFLGGAVGYLAYDLGFTLEGKLKRKNIDDLGLPDCFFNFYNTVIIIDHIKKLFYIFSVGFPEKSYLLGKALCKSNFRKIYKLLSNLNADSRKILHSSYNPKRIFTGQALKSNFTKDAYIQAINKAKEYIKAGDIYQVNLSQRFKASTNLSSFEIYQRLRNISPSYFSAYLDCDDFQILSSSPERFLRLEGKRVITCPMKGTRPRGKSKTQDAFLKKELLKSKKDKAELVMIVDLERNDLGRVCNYNSIKVSALRQIEKYSTVFQTTATVEGRLHRDKDRIHLLRACFPGGSVTGCPKIRAMEIIEELEPTARSVYTGSLGYLSFSGNMDFNILIRTILKKENKLYFGVGGGIVADSRPEDEYDETLVKARGMIEAIYS